MIVIEQYFLNFFNCGSLIKFSGNVGNHSIIQAYLFHHIVITFEFMYAFLSVPFLKAFLYQKNETKLSIYTLFDVLCAHTITIILRIHSLTDQEHSSIEISLSNKQIRDDQLNEIPF